MLFPRLMPSNLGLLGENLWWKFSPYKLPKGEMIAFFPPSYIALTFLALKWQHAFRKKYKKEKEIKITVLNKKQNQSAVSRNRATGILSLFLWVRGIVIENWCFFLPFTTWQGIMKGSMEEKEDYGLQSVTSVGIMVLPFAGCVTWASCLTQAEAPFFSSLNWNDNTTLVGLIKGIEIMRPAQCLVLSDT